MSGLAGRHVGQLLEQACDEVLAYVDRGDIDGADAYLSELCRTSGRQVYGYVCARIAQRRCIPGIEYH